MDSMGVQQWKAIDRRIVGKSRQKSAAERASSGEKLRNSLVAGIPFHRRLPRVDRAALVGPQTGAFQRPGNRNPVFPLDSEFLPG
jgi:hypothetical protein